MGDVVQHKCQLKSVAKTCFNHSFLEKNPMSPESSYKYLDTQTSFVL